MLCPFRNFFTKYCQPRSGATLLGHSEKRLRGSMRGEGLAPKALAAIFKRKPG